MPVQEKEARLIPIALYPKLVDLQIQAFGFTPKLVSACRNLTISRVSVDADVTRRPRAHFV